MKALIKRSYKSVEAKEVCQNRTNRLNDVVSVYREGIVFIILVRFLLTINV